MKNGRKTLIYGLVWLGLFGLWTVLVQTVEVRPVGPQGTEVGFASLNSRFHSLTGVHMGLYILTDWLGLVPVAVGLAFAVLGLCQLARRKSLLCVDRDLLLLGLYYLAVVGGYLLFEEVPINYRPVLLAGRLEASYPSSTTLLILGVMPTLTFQGIRRGSHPVAKQMLSLSVGLFSAFMVLGRTVSGVHWLTDIVGSLLLSGGLFRVYKGLVFLCDEKTEDEHGIR